MNGYEFMFILDPTLDSAASLAVVERVEGIVKGQGGQIVSLKAWERRRLAYPVGGRHEGLYMLCYFDAPPEAIDGIESRVRLAEGVLRFIVLRTDKETREADQAAEVRRREERAARAAAKAQREQEAAAAAAAAEAEAEARSAASASGSSASGARSGKRSGESAAPASGAGSRAGSGGAAAESAPASSGADRASPSGSAGESGGEPAAGSDRPAKAPAKSAGSENADSDKQKENAS